MMLLVHIINCLQVSKLEFAEVREQPKMNRINIAIFAMICCFWPLGLVALLKAIRVSPLYLGNQNCRCIGQIP